MTDIIESAATNPTTDPVSPERADAALPVVDDPDIRVSRPREVRRQARRRFLQMMGAVGVGMGLAFTDGLSTRFARPAGAAAYEVWGDCRGYFSSSTTCVPSSAYYGSDNCDGNTWHRNDTVVVGVTLDVVLVGIYTHLPSTCAGRNAWLWAWAGGQSTKCSDGRKEVWRATSTESTLLSSQFSICRTTGFF
jgi:hypothetical protein